MERQVSNFINVSTQAQLFIRCQNLYLQHQLIFVAVLRLYFTIDLSSYTIYCCNIFPLRHFGQNKKTFILYDIFVKYLQVKYFVHLHAKQGFIFPLENNNAIWQSFVKIRIIYHNNISCPLTKNSLLYNGWSTKH